jgi:hypothetical protein
MSYTIVSKYSNELSSEEWIEIKDSFNLVFEKDFDLKYFKNKYTLNPLGFSCHGILYFNTKIVGFFTVIPRKYNFFDKKKLIGLGCDAYIMKQHRVNEFFLKEMSDSIIIKISEFGVNNFISLPNPNAYRYWKILGKWKDIDGLDYYYFPVNIGKIVFKKSILAYLSYGVSYVISFIFKLFYYRSINTSTSNISIDMDDKTKKERFFLDTYDYLKLRNNDWACYRIVEENGVKVAYIIYINRQSKRNFALAVFKLVSQLGLKVDMILYIGNLKKKPINLFKVPKSKRPREMNFIGLCKDKNEQEILKIHNWDISLVDFDNR